MTVRVLTVGNSFSDNATEYLEQIAASAGDEIIVGRCDIGGCSLEKHWNLIEQQRIAPDIKPYDFYHTGHESVTATLAEALASDKWDYVTLQQVSDLSFRSDSFFPYINLLADFIRAAAPSARLLCHQTWAYRCDAREYVNYKLNREEMQLLCEHAYNVAADSIGARIIPAGEALWRADKLFGYKPDPAYDFENPLPPALPDQTGSLNRGYFWSLGATWNGKANLELDARHLNNAGLYLAALVWYHSLTGHDVNGVTFMPEGLSTEDAARLRSCVL